MSSCMRSVLIEVLPINQFFIGNMNMQKQIGLPLLFNAKKQTNIICIFFPTILSQPQSQIESSTHGDV